MPQLSNISSITPKQHTKKKLNWGGKPKQVSLEPSNSRQALDMMKSVDYLKDQRYKRETEGRPKITDDKIWDKYMKD